jgi:uncharacterized membrane protein
VASRERFPFVDQFRGMVGVMMALGHSSGYFNGIWHSLNMFDPFFSSWGQFALRYMGYLCAPGFLMMNGTVAWYSYTRRVASGKTPRQARWHLMQRGIFLILVQVLFVNHAWDAFTRWNLAHIGIIATIGMSMITLSLILHTKWYIRLTIALGAFVLHAFLLRISYSPAIWWQRVIMETFVTAGDWNKYPMIPWFGLATMGSVMATGWLQGWKSTGVRIRNTFIIGFSALAVATVIRYLRGFGNLTPFDQFGHYSFFMDTKYPPSLFHNIWFFGAVCCSMGMIQTISRFFPPAVKWLGAVGKVPLFFYCMHITILAIVAIRFHVYYRQGAVVASLIGWVALLAVMWPLARWFGGVKERSKNYLIQMI